MLLLTAGVAYYLASAIEKTMDRITLPQLLYVMYMMGCTVLIGWVGSHLAIMLLYASIPVAMIAWLTLSGELDPEVVLEEEFQRQISLHRKALEAHPDDILLLE